MNKRKVTKLKGSKSSKNNDQAEVFVLPPNLLEELGINLGSIETTPQSTMGCQESDKYFPPKETGVGQIKDNHIQSNDTKNRRTTDSEKESSIIQTANLMKASVFLSPTFISNNKSTIEEEFEVVENNYIDKVISKIDECSLGDCQVTEEVSFVLPETISISDFKNPSNAQSSISTQDAIKDDQNTDDHVMIHNNTKLSPYDEHADEAYSSDCSNSNMDKADSLNSSNLHLCCEIKQNVNKKINIISEQIIDPSQFQKFNKCSSPKGNNLIPVTMNTVIKSQYNITNYEYITNKNICPDLITDCLNPTEMFDGENTYFPTEVDKTSINANVNIKETKPESIDNSDSNHILLNDKILLDIQKQDELINCNETVEISTHAIQQNDDSTKQPYTVVNVETVDSVGKGNSNKPSVLIEKSNTSYNETVEISTHAIQQNDDSTKQPYGVVNVEAVDVGKGHSNKPDVLIEKCNTSTATKFMFEDEKVNQSLENVNAISFHEQNSYEDNKNIKGSSPESVNKVSDKNNDISRSTKYHIEEGAEKCRDNVMSTKDGIKNHLFKSTSNSQFNQNRKESNLNVEKQDLKHKNKKRSCSKESSDLMTKESIICQSPNVQVDKNTDEYDNHGSNIQKSDANNKSKRVNSENGTFRDSAPHRAVKTDRTENSADTEIDKVKEIAKYLSQFAEIQKRKTCNVTYTSNKTNISPNKKHAANSKLSIQGVEKPGGSLNKSARKYKKNVRTYVRKNKCVSTVKMISDKYINVNIPTQNIDLPDKNTPDTCNETELCLCGDFGRLISYDIQNVHEKVCFRDINETICTPDIMFSIYTEHAFSANFKDDDHKESSVDEEYAAYTSKEIMSCDDNGPVAIIQRSEHIPENVKPILQKTNSNIGDEMLPGTPVCHANQTSGKDLENCDKRTNDRYDPDPNEIPSTTRQKRKLSPRVDDSCESRSKKRRDIQFPPKYVKYTPKQNAAKEEYAVEDSQNKNQFVTSSDHDSRVESVIHSSLITHGVLNEAAPVTSDLIKCGVCEGSMPSKDWICHIESEHNYLAWKHGEKALEFNKEKTVQEHLSDIIKELGRLKCAKCGLIRKYVKSYLAHVKRCDGLNESHETSACNTSSDTVPIVEPVTRNTRKSISNISVKDEPVPINRDLVKCGVCGESMQPEVWMSHIELKHNYLAWKCGEVALDVNNEDSIREHLHDITKKFGGLKCAKCGVIRKYVKSYLTHIRTCDGLSESQNASAFDTSSDNASRTGSVSNTRTSIGTDSVKNEAVLVTSELVKCGVCEELMHSRDWQTHIESEHHYLAWKSGEPVLDVNNEESVRDHLYDLTKELGGLKCAKCGVIRKYVKSYLAHIQDCNGLSETLNASAFDTSSDNASRTGSVSNTRTSIGTDRVKNEAALVKSEVVKCGVCEKSMHCRDWQTHLESQHHYLAWKSGEQVLDVDDEEAVREHLYGFMKELGGLKCAKCGVIRKYVKPYLTHIQNCNGPSESQNDSAFISENQAGGASNEAVKCGVCGETMQCTDWHSHIQSRHDYLAWKHGEPNLDMNHVEAVHEHLYNISKKYGALKCSKCGRNRKYVKTYLCHVQNCNGRNESQEELNSSLEVFEEESACRVSESTINGAENELAPETHELTKCGVCGQFMQATDWLYHIRTQHDYLAWKSGETALDLDNEEAVHEHFYGITKEYGGLECSKCGVTRKYVKSYLSHVYSCSEPNVEQCDSDPVNTSRYEVVLDVASSPSELSEDLVKCGTCGQYMVPKEWMAHIANEHNYLAWKAGDPPLDVKDERQVRHHLQKLIEEIGALSCSKCGLRRKYVKTYRQHIRKCRGPENFMNDSILNDETDNSEIITDEVITPTSGPDQIKCGVCGEILETSLWISHIAEQHKYLAWKEGETPLDINDKENVGQHLKSIIKKCGTLTCKTCGKTVKLVKTYLQHIETCDQDFIQSNAANSTLDINEPCVDFDSGGTCGVCRQAVAPGNWIQHTQRRHNYLAWRDGEKPWDLDDFTELNKHLYVISKKMNGLICNKCGLVRKYVKSYLTHIKNCTGADSNIDFSLPDDVGPLSSQALYQCAMCKEKIEPAQWKKHAMSEHYNITWIVGQTPIDIKNPYAVERFLKEYRDKHGLKCKCGASRVSCAGFYAHIITCGKTEEQIEMFKSICDICNNSYLCIYKNQHMAIHRVQEYNKELKLKKIEDRKLEEEKVEEITPSGKRRAAQKARSVIENYSNDLDQHTFKCEFCGFGTEFRDELKSHKCEISNEADFSGEESSSAEEPSGDDSAESSLASDASADEQEQEPTRKRYRPSVTSKVPRLPFQVAKPTAYLLQADEDFCNAHFTGDTLYPQWHSCELDVVSECDLSRYLPPIEQSCKVKSSSSWMTLKRFEALKEDAITLFVGACIVSISWIPLRVDDIFSGTDNFLAIACHNDVDDPRYHCEETPSHENLIQIWEFNTRQKLPKIVLGIAHDFGAVWSMDWCPSGARDLLPEDFKDGLACRLGLLAVACSNGSAYIFSVPYPSTVVKNHEFIYKLKPVAELRMTMNSNRKLYQATSVTWSKEKGHKIVLVGYADGSTAYYDLSCDSPLLRAVDNNVDVFYPYHDERPHNSCITATDMYPSALSESGAAVAVAAGVTGAELGAARRGAGGARARFPVAGRAAAFAPHWPAAMLAGDVAVMSTAVNELEWGAAGRRLGGVRALAGCARCGAVAAATPPALRLMRTHPVYPDLKKQVIGMLELTRHDNKRNKKMNDDLAMQIEPLTYADTVKTYGIEFRIVREVNRAKQRECTSKPRAHCPERFPLADIKSMAFCPSWKYHNRLAIATHSGIVFLMNVAS